MIFWKKNKKQQSEETYYTANQWQLIWRKFRKHRLANVGAVIIFFLYFIALFCEFLAPYNPGQRHANFIYMPPKWPQMSDSRGNWHLIPFTPAAEAEFNYDTFSLKYNYDDTKRHELRLFVKGEPYKFWGLFEWDRHLVGVEEGGVFFPFGTDRFGRCIYSRLLYGTRISMTIGLVGVILSLTLGMLLGGISGYYGGWIDIVIQRIIELLRAFPSIPLWMGLSAALPPHWSPLKIYFGITLILSFLGWTGLARVVRGRVLSLREEDFVRAAVFAGAGTSRIIRKHLLPSCASHIIVSATLAIPRMILAETSLSFLGLGLQPPIVSWGVMLKEAQNLQAIAFSPWLLTPAIFVVLAVLGFNFLGDGLRDAADPYRS